MSPINDDVPPLTKTFAARDQDYLHEGRVEEHLTTSTVEDHAGNPQTWAWMQMLSGGVLDLPTPRMDQIDIHDIAGALSKQCRYGGHCLHFYSVAEHCVIAARHAAPEFRLTTLMHDASEAYLVDVPRPIKSLLSNYRELEAMFERLIARRFNYIYPYPEEVKRLDEAMLAVEQQQNMAPCVREWGLRVPPIEGCRLEFWTPAVAEGRFLEAFFSYGGLPFPHS
jgi:hypothetical protein